MKKSGRAAKKQAAADQLDQLRRGMPAKDSVREVVDFVSPKNVKYKILKTTEKDAYDRVETPAKKRSKKP